MAVDMQYPKILQIRDIMCNYELCEAKHYMHIIDMRMAMHNNIQS